MYVHMYIRYARYARRNSYRDFASTHAWHFAIRQIFCLLRESDG